MRAALLTVPKATLCKWTSDGTAWGVGGDAQPLGHVDVAARHGVRGVRRAVVGRLRPGEDESPTPHALRHYSVAELLTAGVDLRTVAGRLGHGGGGSTTLRVYAAWVAASDRKAAEPLRSRLPPRRP